MTIRRYKGRSRRNAGLTLIELLEVIAAIVLGAWLAGKASSHFTGAWHTIVYWTLATAGSGVIFVCLWLGFGHLIAFLRRRKSRNESERK